MNDNPRSPNAHSLAGLLYAVQKRLPESEASFREAQKAYVNPPWMNFNKAVLAIESGEFEDAADLLKEHTTSHPPKKQKVANSIYRAAWRLLRRLAVKHPELDPVLGIRQGLIKRVLAEDYANFLEKNKRNPKPLRELPLQSFVSHNRVQMSRYGVMTNKIVRHLLTEEYDDLKAGRLSK